MRQVCGLDVHKDSVFVCILNDRGIVFHPPDWNYLSLVWITSLKTPFRTHSVASVS